MTPSLAVDLGYWTPTPPVRRTDLLVVVAPHPDDEVLGAGITMRWWEQQGGHVLIVGCTDGEASHARSTAVSADELRRRRTDERAAALARLGLAAMVTDLGLADGRLTAQRGELAAALRQVVPARSTILVPWVGDDHPDHQAASAAGRDTARRLRCDLWQTPVWGKVRGTLPEGPGCHRLHLSPTAHDDKVVAASAFTSQLEPLGPGREDGPVVHPHELAAMLDGTEVVLT